MNGPTRALLIIALQLAALRVITGASVCKRTCLGPNDEDICLTDAMICDHFPDCETGEDEENCGCAGFKCQNGDCISSTFFCDGTFNCFDNSDELNCTKNDYMKSRPLLAEKDICIRTCMYQGSCRFTADGFSECDCAQSFTGPFCDESTYGKALKDAQTGIDVIDETIAKLFMQCRDGTKIKVDLRCDGRFDCDDKSDELNCTRSDYKAAQPHLRDNELCLMECERSSCQFRSNGSAYCDCPTGFVGDFCEYLAANLDNHAKDNEDNKVETMQHRQNKALNVTVSQTAATDDGSTGRSVNSSVENLVESRQFNFTTLSCGVVLGLLCIAAVLWLFVNISRTKTQNDTNGLI